MADVGVGKPLRRSVGLAGLRLCPLGHQQPVALIGREVDAGSQKSALVSDLPRLDPG